MATVDNARTALLGRPDGNRQRMFRKAKATVKKVQFRARPEKIDGPYLNGLGKAALAEFLGLFLFVFISAGATTALSEVTGGATDAGYTLAVAFAHGITIALTVAIAAAWSGGHINPAVTFAFVLSGRLDALAGLVYWVAQLLGSLAGGFFLWTLWGTKWGLASHAFGPHISAWAGLEVELFLTFNLVLTVWGTAVDPRGNHTLAPYFIGLAVFVGVLFGAPLTGPSMNPARTFGVAVFTGNFDHHWVYWLGPLLGGALAGLVYEFAFIKTTEVETSDDVYEEIDVGGTSNNV